MTTHNRWMPGFFSLLALGALACGTGCQVTTNGQLLPSGYFLSDDVQYFPPGPEFKLAREAAAMKAYNSDEAARLERNRQR